MDMMKTNTKSKNTLTQPLILTWINTSKAPYKAFILSTTIPMFQSNTPSPNTHPITPNTLSIVTCFLCMMKCVTSLSDTNQNHRISQRFPCQVQG